MLLQAPPPPPTHMHTCWLQALYMCTHPCPHSRIHNACHVNGYPPRLCPALLAALVLDSTGQMQLAVQTHPHTGSTLSLWSHKRHRFEAAIMLNAQQQALLRRARKSVTEILQATNHMCTGLVPCLCATTQVDERCSPGKVLTVNSHYLTRGAAPC